MPRVPQPAVVKISQAFDILGGETIDRLPKSLRKARRGTSKRAIGSSLCHTLWT